MGGAYIKKPGIKLIRPKKRKRLVSKLMSGLKMGNAIIFLVTNFSLNFTKKLQIFPKFQLEK